MEEPVEVRGLLLAGPLLSFSRTRFAWPVASCRATVLQCSLGTTSGWFWVMAWEGKAEETCVVACFC